MKLKYKNAIIKMIRKQKTKKQIYTLFIFQEYSTILLCIYKIKHDSLAINGLCVFVNKEIMIYRYYY